MSSKKLFVFVSSLLLFFGSTTESSAITPPFYPTDDIHVSSYSPEVNYGSNDFLLFYRDSDGAPQTYPILKFNLSSIPTGSTINSAVLYLYVSESDLTSSAIIKIYQNTINWDESTTNWSTRPGYSQQSPDYSLTPSSSAWKQFDISDYAKDWVDNPSSNYGISIRGPLIAYNIRFLSKESPSNRPYLLVDYSSPEEEDNQAPQISDIQTLDITSTSAKITWKTNENSSSWVEYGNSAAYGFSHGQSEELVTNHTVNVGGLTAGTWHFKVTSLDEANNEAVSGDQTFTITSNAPSATPTPKVSGQVSPTKASDVTTSDSSLDDSAPPASDSGGEQQTTGETKTGGFTTNNLNYIVGGLMTLAGAFIIGAFVWLAKKKKAASSPTTTEPKSESAESKPEAEKEVSPEKKVEDQNKEIAQLHKVIKSLKGGPKEEDKV